MAILRDNELKSFLDSGIIKGTSNKNSGVLSEDKASKIIDAIVTLKKIEGDSKRVLALALIMGIGQNGGSNKNIGTVSYTVDKYSLSNIELNKAIGSIDKAATPRQFFRTIRDEVQELAEAFGEPGDLHRKLLADHPNASLTDQTWCSNFQTGNPNCPELIRDWLLQNAKQRFG